MSMQMYYQLDDLLQEPSYTAILTVLRTCRTTDFTFLQRITNLRTENLAYHLADLERFGAVMHRTKKQDYYMTQHTYELTKVGYDMLERYRRQPFEQTAIYATRIFDDYMNFHCNKLSLHVHVEVDLSISQKEE